MARMQFRVILVIGRRPQTMFKLRDDFLFCEKQGEPCCYFLTTESLILAQNEHWRRGLGMQVERESFLRETSTVANG